MKRLCVIVLNYRRPALTIDCLRSLAVDMAGRPERCVIVIDNGSDDGSGESLDRALHDHQWGSWLTLIRSPINRGFAGGNNLGFAAIDAENYLLLNSDARLQPGAIDRMLQTLDERPEVGVVGPRLQSPEGAAQCSCFRYRTPMSEFLSAAGTSVLDRLFHRHEVALGVFDEPIEPPWMSFACLMIRRAVIQQIGPMDERYFMYFEDIDYSRMIRAAGWRILHDPRARAVHLRGGTSSVKAAMKARARVPRYYYESRSRYFAKYYGGVPGLWLTNLLWLAGRAIALVRETFGSKQPDVCQDEAIDNWTNWLQPYSRPISPRGGDL